jgi:RNase adaptor protein for sRNA GlmZ degradation
MPAMPSLPTLWDIHEKAAGSPDFAPITPHPDKLTVLIRSFSYKEGIPEDLSENGGGFVFDCRALPNPGRYKEYQSMTGMDHPVIDYLQKEPEVELFLDHAGGLVGQSIQTYLGRGFSHLSVSFGCTGGRHRSVFCAEWLAKRLKERFPAVVKVQHTGLGND